MKRDNIGALYFGLMIEAKKPRSAWKKGVRLYAEQLLNDLKERSEFEGSFPGDTGKLESWLLNGAKDWVEFSYGGCALISDLDIANRLCTASELKKLNKAKGGIDMPNKRENWLDVQARALYQACDLLKRLYMGWEA